MKRSFSGLQIVDQFLGSIHRDLIRDRLLNPPVTFDFLIDLNALLAHGTPSC
jgi:hypothetical protein